jgi:sugar lactone lactonase YvrE
VTLTAPPRVEAPPPEALIEQARRRQCRRRGAVGATVAVLALAGGVLLAGRGGGGSGSREHHRGPRAVAPAPSRPSPATAAPVQMFGPEALAAMPDGSVLICDVRRYQILRRAPDGTLGVVAGNGNAGFSGDGGRAVDAALSTPWGLAVRADGTVFFADSANNRVRAISPDGTITTVAAGLSDPTAVALGPDGLYVAGSGSVRVVSVDGTIRTFLGSSVNGIPSIVIDGQPNAFDPSALAVDTAGNVFVANFSPKFVAEFSAAGELRHVWRDVYVQTAGLAAAPDGSILVADYGGFSIDRIAGGQLTTLVQFRFGAVPGLNGTFRPSGVAVAPDGTITTVTDGINGGASAAALLHVDAGGNFRVAPTH